MVTKGQPSPFLQFCMSISSSRWLSQENPLSRKEYHTLGNMLMLTGMYKLKLTEGKRDSHLPLYVHFALFTCSKVYELKVSGGATVFGNLCYLQHLLSPHGIGILICFVKFVPQKDACDFLPLFLIPSDGNI